MHILLQLLVGFVTGIGRSVADLIGGLLKGRERSGPVLTPTIEHPNRLRHEWYSLANPPAFFSDLRWLLQEGHYEVFVRLAPHFMGQMAPGLARDILINAIAGAAYQVKLYAVGVEWAKRGLTGKVSKEIRLGLLCNLGVNHLGLHNWSEADRAFLSALALDPTDRDALYNRLVLEWLRRDTERATLAAKELLVAHPSAADPGSFLGQTILGDADLIAFRGTTVYRGLFPRHVSGTHRMLAWRPSLRPTVLILLVLLVVVLLLAHPGLAVVATAGLSNT